MSMVVKKHSAGKSEKAGLLLPVARVNRAIKKRSGVGRVGASAPVFLTAVLEDIVKEVVEHAGDLASKANRKRISPVDITSSIRGDPQLARLFAGVAVFSGDAIGRDAKNSALCPRVPKALKE